MDDATVFAAIPMPATLIDTEGLIVDVNEIFLEWARSMGRDLRKEDRIGHHVAEFSGVFEEREQFVDFIDKLLGEQRSQQLRWEGRPEDGHLVWGDIRGQVIHDQDGTLVGAIILREDVTQEVIRERRQQLSQRLRDEIWRMRDADDMGRVMVAVQSTFTLHLPVSTESSEQSPAPTTAAPEGGQGRVLVMDDEEEICRLLERMLAHLGYRSAFAQSGDEAVKSYQSALAEDPFDVVVLDLTVPGGMGGAQTLNALRELDLEVCAVVSSGYSNDPVMARFEEHGFRGVVRKPYVIDQMAEALVMALN